MWKRLDPKISTSEKHAKFGFSPITLWVMMLPHTDAMGRYWANAAYIKGQCLPLFEHVRLEQVDQALRELAEVRLIHLYDSDGKKLLVYHDVTDFNPPGALRYQRPQWGDPPADLCKCLTRRESGAYTPLVSSSSSLSIGSDAVEGDSKGEQIRPAIRHLYQKAKEAKLAGRKETILSYLDSWAARSDAGKVEQYLMDPWSKGKTVIEFQNHFFPSEAPSKGVGSINDVMDDWVKKQKAGA